MSKTSIVAACAQTKPQFGDTDSNMKQIVSMIESTEADLILFPELATSGYQFRSKEELMGLALDVKSGSEIKVIKDLAGDLNRHVAIGIPELSNNKAYNSLALVEPSGKLSVYRKLHLFYEEKLYFEPGDRPPMVIDTEVGKLGLMICFDWVFPEVARLLALQGAQILVHAANLVLTYCQRSMFARSTENGVFSMTCNRVGGEARTDETLTFTGSSQILGNRGAMLVQASAEEEEVVKAELTPSDADNKMMTRYNHLMDDRRTEFFQGLI